MTVTGASSSTTAAVAADTTASVDVIQNNVEDLKLQDNENYVVKNGCGSEPRLLDAEVEDEGVQDILAALTDTEKSQLADANMPLRHFRAEKGDTEKAIEKIKATLQWRQEFQVDKIVNCMAEGGDETIRKSIENDNKDGKIYVRSYNKEGRAVLLLRPGADTVHKEHEGMVHLVYNIERAIRCTEKNGKEKIIVMIDYKGFNLRDAPPLSTSKLTLSILQDHYPERMLRFYLLNPPMMFRIFWNIVKPFIDPVTKQKIVFCHGNAGKKAIEDSFEDMDKLEPCAHGTGNPRDFDSKEYLSTPMNKAFDEK